MVVDFGIDDDFESDAVAGYDDCYSHQWMALLLLLMVECNALVTPSLSLCECVSVFVVVRV